MARAKMHELPAAPRRGLGAQVGFAVQRALLSSLLAPRRSSVTLFFLVVRFFFGLVGTQQNIHAGTWAARFCVVSL